MAAYGDDTTILQMLGPGDESTGFSDALQERISSMNEVVSALVEEKTGRAWISTAPASATRVVYPSSGTSSFMVLRTPAVSISAITVNQDDDDGVISGGSALTAGAWAVASKNQRGEITAIRTNNGGVWIDYQVVSITGIWADEIQTVPADVEWLVNYVTAERIKQEQASPAGFLGPDGTVTPIRDPWNDPQVKDIIRRHRLTGKMLVL
jgi:hypothetical protein